MIAQSDAKLIRACFLNWNSYEIYKTVPEYMLVCFASQPYRVRLSHLIHNIAVIAKSHSQDVKVSSKPAIRILLKCEITGGDVKQGTHERAHLGIVCKERSQTQMNASGAKW